MQGIRWTVISVFILFLTGCGGGGGGTISAPIGYSVSPAAGSLGVGQRQTFTAVPTTATFIGVTWSVKEGVTGGVIDAGGNYTAPATIGTYHVVAANQANPAQTISVPVTVHTLVSITPATLAMAAGATQTFTVTVTGSANSNVVWSVLEASGGVIDANGKYTAPNTGGIYHVAATSLVDHAQGTALISVQGATGSITGTIH